MRSDVRSHKMEERDKIILSSYEIIGTLSRKMRGNLGIKNKRIRRTASTRNAKRTDSANEEQNRRRRESSANSILDIRYAPCNREVASPSRGSFKPPTTDVGAAVT